MRIKFLFDENMDPRYKAALLRLQPEIDVLQVGDPDAPPKGTSDSDLLQFLDTMRRLLVTSNRKSMPGELQAHWSSGGHIWGLCWARPGSSFLEVAADLQLIWGVSEAEEWIDRVERIPYYSSTTRLLK